MGKETGILSNIIGKADRMVGYQAAKGHFRWISDKMYLKIIYRGHMGKRLNLIAPKTYNEKLQWLKLYDHNPIYSQLVDKYRVRDYVEKKIGGQYLIPLLGVWKSADEIDFDALPAKFVLKCNHDTGSVIVCRDKRHFDINAAREKLTFCLANGTYWTTREWPYKNIEPCIIAEEYMEDSTSHDLRDYKFFCFNGLPKAMFIATERLNPEKPTAFDFFDMQFNHLPIKQGHPNADMIPQKPVNFVKMIDLAKVLSEGFPHVRVDFYEVDGRVYFGELTFYHFSGVEPFHPAEWDVKFGEWLNLPGKKI